MTGSSFGDYVAIDTNVFLHLLNPQENVASHIDVLLADFQLRGIVTIVDDSGRIQGEYLDQIGPYLMRTDETGPQADILRYWVMEITPLKVTLDLGDDLMRAIREVIVEPSENVDRILVYVAFRNGSVLISNDERHIVIGPPWESGQRPRRDRLLRSTRRLRSTGADIMTSQEAHSRI